MITKYRIAWKNERTGVSGYGPHVFETQEDAETAIRLLNMELFNCVPHWVEAVEVEDEDEWQREVGA